VFWGDRMENCIFRNSGNFANRVYNSDRIPPYTDGYEGTAPDSGAFEHGAKEWSAGANIK